MSSARTGTRRWARDTRHARGRAYPVGGRAAALITTKGYTQGAIDVAVDENIGLWRLRPLIGKPRPGIRESASYRRLGSTYGDFDVELLPGHGLPPGTHSGQREATIIFFILTALPQDVADVLRNHSAIARDDAGPYRRRASLPDGRRLPVEGGESVPIAALTWTETVHRSPHTTVTKAPGEPVLVLEQLNEKGEPESGRIVFDRGLLRGTSMPTGK